MQAVDQKETPVGDGHRRAHDGLPEVPTGGPVLDGARFLSAVAGALTAGAALCGPIGAVVGGVLGAGLGTWVTARQHHHA